MKPLLAVSMGDPAGIGPEVLVQAAASAAVVRACRLHVFGDPSLLKQARRAAKIPARAPSAIVAVEACAPSFSRARPRPSRRAGAAALGYLRAAADFTRNGEAEALVTAPLNKYWCAKAEPGFDGHTGYLGRLSGAKPVMMLAGRRLRVVLVTEHLALAEVPARLRRVDIEFAARTACRHLRAFAGIDRPALAVAALNPHAGEDGMFGGEEAKIIEPAVRGLRRSGVNATGPHPADTLFAAAAAGTYDAVICMYHDQGLIPLKLVEFGRSVNISMGLPFLRTSPDHGTAYDLAGTGKADPGSMREAILCAAKMARRARQGGKEKQR